MTADHSGKPVSLRDVAERSGVSQATASRVLSGSDHPVNAATRDRVLTAARELGFEPNRLARALATARSQTVGVVVHDVSDPYFGEIIKGLEDSLYPADYSLFVASSDRQSDKELGYVRAFQSHRVDAIVFAASGLTDDHYRSQLLAAVGPFRSRGGIVIVLSDHVLEDPGVRFDNRAGVGEMVRYLHGQGHRSIGYINGPPELQVSRVRLEAFRDALATLDLPFDPQAVVEGGFTAAGGGEAVTKIMANCDVTAVMAANDLMAMGALRALLDSGRSVPEDVSVAGFDDIVISELAPVPLTTMRVPTYEIGKRAGEMILASIEGLEQAVELVQGELVQRQSVAPPSA